MKISREELEALVGVLLVSSFGRIGNSERGKTFSFFCRIIEELVKPKKGVAKEADFQLAGKFGEKASKICSTEEERRRLFDLSVLISKTKAERIFAQAQKFLQLNDHESSWKKFLLCLKSFPIPDVLSCLYRIRNELDSLGKDTSEISKRINGTLAKFQGFQSFVPESQDLEKDLRLEILAEVHAIATEFKDSGYCEKIEKFFKKNHKDYWHSLDDRRNAGGGKGSIFDYIGALVPIDPVAARVSGFKYSK